jgi:hypothetical protein
MKVPAKGVPEFMRNLVLALLVILSLGTCGAQSVTVKPVEPAAIGEVNLLDSSGQTLKPLPDEQWKAKGKPGWSTVIGSIQISGERSSFRVMANEKAEFVFKTGSPEVIRLYPFIQKKNLRYCDLVTLKGVRTKEREIYQGIPVEITKFGESSYKLVPKSPLGPGEYGIDLSGKIFTFGIDQ